MIDRTRIDLLVLPRGQPPAESGAAPSDPTTPRNFRAFRFGGFRVGVERSRAGFAIGPILYLLALIGIGAGILFSSTSQILRSNIQITENMEAQNDLSQAATVLAASSILGSSDNTYLCPPTGGNPSANCALSVEKLETFAAAIASGGTAQLPANYGSAGTTGSPAGFEVGVFAPGSGMKQLDPYGHYYVVCRWERQTSDSTDNSIQIVSAGSDGTLNTPCGNTTTSPANDDNVVAWTAPYAVQHSAVWQTASGGSGNETYFGNAGHQLQVDAMGDLTVPGSLAVTGTATFGNIGTFADAVTAPTFDGNFVGGTISGTTGTLSTLGVTGNTLLGGTLGVTSDTTLGGVLAVTGATTLSSTLAVDGATTLSSTLGVTGQTTLSGALAVTGTAIYGTTTGAQFIVNPLGSAMANGGFIGNLSGNVTGNLSGNQSGGSISATTGFFSGGLQANAGLTVAGATNFTLDSSGNGVFAGSVTAANFNGNINVGNGGGTTITGIVPLANGGTGVNATSNNNLLYQLGVLNGSSYLNMSLVQGGSVTDSMLQSTVGGSGATFYSVTVNAEGVVTGGSTTPFVTNYITDGSDSVTANGGQIGFTTSGVENDVINSQGWLGILTTTPVVPLTVGNPYAALTNEVAQFASGGATSTIAVRSASGSVTSAGILGVTTSGSASTVYLDTGATSGTASLAFRVGGATEATIDGSGDVVASNFDGNLVGGSISATAEALTGTLTGTSAYFSGTVTANNISANSGYFSGTVTAAGFSGNFSGNISMADGTVTAPGLYFTNEVSTGLFRPGSDRFGFAVGGVEAFELETAAGAVDYLTITPATSGNAPLIGVAGNTNEGLTLSSNGSGSITLTPGSSGNVNVSAGALNIASASSGLQLGGNNGISQPANDSGSIAVGGHALASQTTISLYNTAVGYEALYYTNTGHNTAVGALAGENNSAGAYNTFVGYEAGLSSSTSHLTGSYNTGIGELALENINTTANSNTSLGYEAGSKITTGSSNIIIGALSASTTLTTGGSNILIGNALDTTSSTTSNTVNIGGLVQGNLSSMVLGVGLMPQAGAILDLSAGNSATNSSMILPGANTANRPGTGIAGMLRYNSDTTALEAYLNGVWTTLLSDTSSGGSGTTSGIYLGTSTTANPQIYNEPTSGFYTPGSNTIAVETAGSTALTVTATQSVGIGTTAPASTLQVGSGQIEAPSGSSSAPSYSFGPDTGTGIYNSASSGHHIAFTSNTTLVSVLGSTFQRYNSGAILGWASTTNPESNGFDTGFARNAAGVVEVDNGTAGSLATLVASNVGIGTTSPQTGYSMTAESGIYALQNSTTYAAVSAINSTSTGTAATGLGAGVYAAATTSTNSADALYASNTSATGYAGYFNGALNVTGTATIGNLNLTGTCVGCGNGAIITLGSVTTANPQISGEPTSGFYTPGANTIAVETAGSTALTVTATQSVGIGTTAPQQVLDVQGNINIKNTDGIVLDGSGNLNIANVAGFLNLANISGGNGVALTPYNSNASAGWLVAYAGNVEMPSSMKFGWSSSSDPRPTVTAMDTTLSRYAAGVVAVGTNAANENGTLLAGTVGIGTTAPAEALDVRGNLGFGVAGGAGGHNIISFKSLNTSADFTTIDAAVQGGADNRSNVTLSSERTLYLRGTTGIIMQNTGQNGGFALDGLDVASVSSPGSSRIAFTINGASGQTADFFDITANGGSAGGILAVTSTGNVGIGTTAPQTGYSLTAESGVYALQNSTTYAAVSAINSTSTGTAATGLGAGVYAAATTSTNTADALYASNTSSTGYAGYFNGALNVTGTCTGCGNGAIITLGSVTTANPQISGEPTAGFYTPGANTIAAETAGSTALTVTATQSVGIGTTAPGALLDVHGDIRSETGTAAAGGSCSPNGATLAAAAAASGQNLICSSGVWAVVSSGGGAPTWHATNFTSSGTWTLPSGVYAINAMVVGGGGGGGGGPASAAGLTLFGGAGGGGGGISFIYGVAATADLTVTVGAGGSGGSGGATGNPGSAGTSGSAGGASSITQGSTTILYSAGGGLGSTSDTPGGVGAGGVGGAGGGAGGLSSGYYGTCSGLAGSGGGGGSNTGSSGGSVSCSTIGTNSGGIPSGTVSCLGYSCLGGGGGGASFGVGANGGSNPGTTGGAGSSGAANTGAGGGGGSPGTSGSGGAGGAGGSGYAIIWALY